MFTGIIAAVGQLQQRENLGGSAGDLRLTINTGAAGQGLDMSDVQLGDSIAVNGVCLTAVNFGDSYFIADVSRETLAHTSLQHLTAQAPVNLEKALRANDRLGGHLVSGHVDGLGKVINRQDDARSTRFTFSAPSELAHYIARKGSICIDGTSLTVNEVNGQQFGVNIVPHTLQHTIMDHYQAGTVVNLEVDQIARYLERLLQAQTANPNQNQNHQLANQQLAATLAKAGY